MQDSAAFGGVGRSGCHVSTGSSDPFLCRPRRALVLTLSKQRSRFHTQSGIRLRHLAEVWLDEVFVSSRLSMCQVNFSYKQTQ